MTQLSLLAPPTRLTLPDAQALAAGLTQMQQACPSQEFYGYAKALQRQHPHLEWRIRFVFGKNVQEELVVREKDMLYA